MRSAKVDRNQPVTVAALRALGFMVQPTHTLGGGAPDFIAMGYHEKLDAPTLLWVELKCGRGDLTLDEREWHGEWRAIHRWPPIIVARSLRDILRAFGWLDAGIEAALSGISDRQPVKRALAAAKRKYGDDPDIAATLL